MLRRRALSAALALLLPACLAAGPGYADCTNPAGKEGDQLYNYDYHTFQFCNGTGWLAYGGGSACTPVGNYSPTAPSGSGYFVLTSTTWNGNLGRLSGADAKCLTEIGTTNTGWLGYSTANGNGQLVASKVHAFVCTGDQGCNNPMPLTTYYFANAGNSGAGGASFTTNSNGFGPGDSANWSAANYFGGTYTYWTNMNAGAATLWPGTGQGGGNGALTCNNFASSSGNAASGSSGNTNALRWSGGFPSCASTNYLICFVNP